MRHLRAPLAKLFVVVYLAVGQIPRAVALLDVLSRPSVARVMLTRRRALAYSEFFTPADRDGRRAAPIAHAGTDDGAAAEYIPVRAA